MFFCSPKESIASQDRVAFQARDFRENQLGGSKLCHVLVIKGIRIMIFWPWAIFWICHLQSTHSAGVTNILQLHDRHCFNTRLPTHLYSKNKISANKTVLHCPRQHFGSGWCFKWSIRLLQYPVKAQIQSQTDQYTCMVVETVKMILQTDTCLYR